MGASPLAWLALGVVVVGLLTLDFVGHARSPHPPGLREAVGWSLAYMALAAAYGAVVWALAGAAWGQEFYAGWVTEWSLSVDNLFVFILILSAFRVPRAYQQKALLAGIVIALVLRLVFIRYHEAGRDLLVGHGLTQQEEHLLLALRQVQVRG